MKKEDCIFCKLANGEIPTNALYEDEIVKVIFDLGPATKGHVLVIPKEHFDDVFSIDERTAAHVLVVASKVAKALKEELQCDGMNLLQNNGTLAGQTVFHFHMHIIPRYQEDEVKITWPQGKADEELITRLMERVQISLH